VAPWFTQTRDTLGRYEGAVWKTVDSGLRGEGVWCLGPEHKAARAPATAQRAWQLGHLLPSAHSSTSNAWGACGSASRTWAMHHQHLRDTTAIADGAPVSRPICGGARARFGRQSRRALTCSSERRNPPECLKRVQSGRRGARQGRGQVTSERQPLSAALGPSEPGNSLQCAANGTD
jgi:hypothetical protein